MEVTVFFYLLMPQNYINLEQKTPYKKTGLNGYVYYFSVGLLSTCTTESFGGSLVFNSEGCKKCVSSNNQPW